MEKTESSPPSSTGSVKSSTSSGGSAAKKVNIKNIQSERLDVVDAAAPLYTSVGLRTCLDNAKNMHVYYERAHERARRLCLWWHRTATAVVLVLTSVMGITTSSLHGRLSEQTTTTLGQCCFAFIGLMSALVHLADFGPRSVSHRTARDAHRRGVGLITLACALDASSDDFCFRELLTDLEALHSQIEALAADLPNDGFSDEHVIPRPERDMIG